MLRVDFIKWLSVVFITISTCAHANIQFERQLSRLDVYSVVLVVHRCGNFQIFNALRREYSLK